MPVASSDADVREPMRQGMLVLVVLLLALSSPVRADGGVPVPLAPGPPCPGSNGTVAPCQPGECPGPNNTSGPCPGPAGMLYAARQCTLVAVHLNGPPRIRTDPVLGIVTVDPDGCIRGLVRI
ncbi:MAG: hypothetical protein ACYDBQ_11075 [Thermoplasmatota archaeon]